MSGLERQGSLDGSGRGGRLNLSDDEGAAPGDEYEDHGHTLSAMQGKQLRRELSTHNLVPIGYEAGDHGAGSPETTSPLSTPSQTLTGAEAGDLSHSVNEAPVELPRRDPRRNSLPERPRLDSIFNVPPTIDESEISVGVPAPGGGAGSGQPPSHRSDADKPKTFRAMKTSSQRQAQTSQKTQRRTTISSADTSAGTFTLIDSARHARKSNESVGAKRRGNLKSVARDCESLLLIGDALRAKDMPGLADRLTTGLRRIQDNAREGYTDEGIVAQKRQYQRAVNRREILKSAMQDAFGGDTLTGRMARRLSASLGAHREKQKQQGDAKDVELAVTKDHEPPVKKKRELTLRDHCVRTLVIGFAFLLLCCMPAIMEQYTPDAGIAATTGSVTASANPIYMKLSHHEYGTYEVTVGAGYCLSAVSSTYTSNSYYSAHVVLMQDDTELKSDSVQLETSTYNKRRRNLLAGGADTGPYGSHTYETFYWLADPQRSGSDLKLKVYTDCPEPVGLSLEVVTVGPIGVAQVWVALVLLIATFVLIILEVVHRTLIAFIASAAVLFMLALEHRLPSIPTIMTWMDHGTLALLWGMMIIVSLLARTGVFEYISVQLIIASKMDPWRLTWLLMIFDAVLSAFLDNVSTMLLLGPVIVSMCKAIRQDPRPWLIPMALFGNIGGTATMIGDPPNLIIGNSLSDEIGFVDFLKVLAPGVILTMFPALLFLRWYYGRDGIYSKKIDVDVEELVRRYPIRDHVGLARCGIILCFVLVLFFLHPVLHFEPAYAALFGAIAILVMSPSEDFEHALEKVEWDSLLFFAGLFVFTQGISELGLLRVIADALSDAIENVDEGSRNLVSSVLIQVVAAVASAFVDNIPFTTTMLPVIKRMAKNVEGVEIRVLAWALCFGADYGGMGTIIGASANVVMAGIAAEAGYPVSFSQFFKIGWPMMCISLCVSIPYLCAMIELGNT
ncbi:arsenite-antimonite efflux family [Micromonas pusilla CCMP1545]|jgi:Na+/H+ antiporter NhaD/arsenite permease-like protein|uniref:Arsenite-antimonite efflux family n=2 Tax=Micromonas pusilla TaxID=38833 RepID=C1MQZ0_MICPC|nr:arsenite-antimonite efflux family [Micromonas pusilla CCMP1545]EEH58164.1 arsenite-antimonite efflux family [Micromonas pusilla CCMP1545]|tara:strand:- start:1462 stop:4338 length:2877 start_codon:yes stop_codon:yes gene_type:complete|eukprot:XP_003058213.1 arsenite-antimonite efflux family [Micromonas pusilla CCMP1545]